MADYAQKIAQTVARADDRRAGQRSTTPGGSPLQSAMNQTAVVQGVTQLRHVLNHGGRVAGVAQLSSLLQRAPDEVMQGRFEVAQRVEEEELLQGKFNTVQRVEEEEELQAKFDTVQREEVTTASNPTGMPGDLKAGIESLSGMDLSDVRVHTNSDKPAELNALAYAQGSDIHLARGQERHLPHEAWHVVQQRQGRVAPTMQFEGVNINDDHGLEAEADRMGAQASQMKKDPTHRGA
jgi:hypothetical protein